MPTLGIGPNSLDPISGDAILALVAALGLSSVAGLRASLTLFAVGLAYDIPGPGGAPLLPLQNNFKVLGSPPVLIILAILVVAEFAVDKIPGLDHVNDIIHTVVRPVVGAAIVAGTTNSLSDTSVWLAAIVGALLAFTVHGVKAGARAAVTTTTVGVGNPVVSVIEDILSVVAIALLITLPIVGAVVALIVVLLAWRIIGWFTGRRRRAREREELQHLRQVVARQGSVDQQTTGGASDQRSFQGAIGVAPLPASAFMTPTETLSPASAMPQGRGETTWTGSSTPSVATTGVPDDATDAQPYSLDAPTLPMGRGSQTTS